MDKDQRNPDSGLAATRSRLREARLMLLAADQDLIRLRQSDTWQVGEGLDKIGRRHPVIGRLVFRLLKGIVWTLSGELPERIAGWRRARGKPDLEISRVASSPSSPLVAPPLPRTGGRSILIADWSVPKPDRNAGAKATIAIIDILLGRGWSVTFWPHDRMFVGVASDEDDEPYVRRLLARGVHILDARRDGWPREWLGRFGDSLDHIMLMRPTIARDLLPDVLRCSGAWLSYFGHDLHFARLKHEAELTDDPTLAVEASKSLAVERSVWRLVDVVLYPSEEEAAVVAELEPGITALPFSSYSFTSFERRRSATQGAVLLFVGGFAHRPNGDAVIWFVEEIFPLIRDRRPDARLIVVGGGAPPEVKALAGTAIEIAGTVSDEDLANHYASARVAVVPLRFGAGVKGKVVEALHAGVPVVTTGVGVQGLPGLPTIVPVRDKAADFASAVVNLLADDKGWLDQSIAQVAYAESHFSQDVMLRDLLRAFDPII